MYSLPSTVYSLLPAPRSNTTATSSGRWKLAEGAADEDALRPAQQLALGIAHVASPARCTHRRRRSWLCSMRRR